MKSQKSSYQIRGPRDAHPSGRPRNVSEKKENPHPGFSTKPMTPRLRQEEAKDAIGFLAHLAEDADEN